MPKYTITLPPRPPLGGCRDLTNGVPAPAGGSAERFRG